MAVTLTTPQTLLGTIAPRTDAAKLVAGLVTIVLGTVLITLCSKISVPTWPIPVTLQTFAVAALAAAFGWRIGLATVALYIVEGLSGLPVFAGIGAGPGYLFGPTGGFIIGFLPMAAIIGGAADMGAGRSGRNLIPMMLAEDFAGFAGALLPIVLLFAAMLVADALVFAFGYAWLVTVLSGSKGVGPYAVMGAAFDGAIKPFVLWDVLKMAFAALSVAGAWTLVRRKA